MDCKRLLDFFVRGVEPTSYELHPSFKTSKAYFLEKICKVAKALLQINIPIHTIPFLLFKLKTLR